MLRIVTGELGTMESVSFVGSIFLNSTFLGPGSARRGYLPSVRLTRKFRAHSNDFDLRRCTIEIQSIFSGAPFARRVLPRERQRTTDQSLTASQHSRPRKRRKSQNPPQRPKQQDRAESRASDTMMVESSMNWHHFQTNSFQFDSSFRRVAENKAQWTGSIEGGSSRLQSSSTSSTASVE